MNNKLTGLLGMSRRAGKLTAGFDAVERLLKSGKADVVLMASNLSAKTEKELRFAAKGRDDRLFSLPLDKMELGKVLGFEKPLGVLALSDKGFAAAIRKQLTPPDTDADNTSVRDADQMQEGMPNDD